MILYNRLFPLYPTLFYPKHQLYNNLSRGEKGNSISPSMDCRTFSLLARKRPLFFVPVQFRRVFPVECYFHDLSDVQIRRLFHHVFIFFSTTNRLISTKLGIKFINHSWVTKINKSLLKYTVSPFFNWR